MTEGGVTVRQMRYSASQRKEGAAMERFLCAVAVLTVGLACAAHAQVTLDLGKVTCSQLVTYKITNPKYISVWISGYYHGTQGKMVVDTQRLVDNADKLESYCLKNPDILVLQAVETVLGPFE
jgi:acid stress chaperone HdeB